ncbi:YoaK family protein [Aureimonas leprariae]|uniref:YoaK family protein n=1 Tax=Plantimonas leprariae TaxID=2615207 RepID=UPI001FE3FE07|nr:YoaK family protein [Aureimonas leprariae]
MAAFLAALAGYVDAIGFLKLGGLFVSFMSGNSTRLAVALGLRSPEVVVAGGLITAFLGGVIAGSLVAAIAGAIRKPAVLVLTTCLLAGAAAFDGSPGDFRVTALMAAAMGCANCVFQRDGEVSVGVTYITGTLVKLGQHLAAVLLGRDRLGWVPYLLLWSGLVTGAVGGAKLYTLTGAAALWIAAVVAGLLAVVAWLLGPAQPIKSVASGQLADRT